MPAEELAGDEEAGSLARELLRWTREDGDYDTLVPGLSLHRRSAPTEPGVAFYKPGLAIVAQGAKQVALGEEIYVYDSETFLLTSVDLPVACKVVEASAELPYLALVVDLDPREIALMLAEIDTPAPASCPPPRGMAVSTLQPALQSAATRFVRLLEEPATIPVLGPLIRREILYRLLTGEQAARMRDIAATGGRSQQIVEAINWLGDNFRRPLRIEMLARRIGMSASSFHHHFRGLTGMSPLQYQKHLRLREARRLLVEGHVDAGTAALEVGYESASQFSREYSRAFGAPPLRDVSRLRKPA